MTEKLLTGTLSLNTNKKLFPYHDKKNLEKCLLPPFWLPEEEVWASYTSDTKAMHVLAPNSSSTGQPTCTV